MGCTLFWVKFGHAFAYFVVSCLLTRWHYYSILISMVPGRHGKYILHKKVSYLQGILNDINEQDTSFLDCKHKHMMKSGAPPDKFLSCTVWLPIEFRGFTSRSYF